jgi:16S rRNA (uracil1498-N3)-methyltransferase
MTRFFIPTGQFQEQTVTLTGADAHHLCKVLRARTGDEIIVLNGKGREFQARITVIAADMVTAEITGIIERNTEPKLRIMLVQSLPKLDKFEFILEKNTELGVAVFQPLITERSLIKLDGKSLPAKMERWRKIIQSAAEQSGRQILPELKAPLGWAAFRRQFPSGLILLPWEGEQTQSLKAVLERQAPGLEQTTIIIGPEGGFSLYEVEQAQAAGAVPVTLGPRILRTETAGLVAASAVLYHFGEMG